MWLIEEKTLPVFNDMVAKEMASLKGISHYAFEPEQGFKDEWTLGHRDVVGVHPQKQTGLNWIGVHVPMGRLSADECVEIAALADKYSKGEIRLTVDQNFLLPNIPDDQVDAFKNEPIFTKEGSRLSIHPSNIIGHAVSCTGAQFCPLAMVETKIPIDRILRLLDAVVEMPHAVRIHATGCPNRCNNPHSTLNNPHQPPLDFLASFQFLLPSF